MKRTVPILAAALAAGLAASSADARSFYPMPGAKGMRVSASFQTMVPISGPSNVEAETKATESARRSLYEIAARECEVITRVFKGDCRIINLSVRSYVRDRGNGIRQISISANATYSVTPDQEMDRDTGDRGKKL
ncbi:MAG: hypothetical protein KDJ29_01195 [Hyphomicrobiales bacterium]|nr:hypothetical protein [Hyphomicrobiales bacterium]